MVLGRNCDCSNCDRWRRSPADIELLRRPVLKKWFGEVRPAATMIQAGLMEEAMKIEIEAMARKSDDRERAVGKGTEGPLGL